MTRTRKRKKSGLSIKQLEAKNRNHFLRELKKILIDNNCEIAYQILPQQTKHAIYSLRTSSMKIRSKLGTCIPSDLLKEITEYIDDQLQIEKVDLSQNESKISVKLLYTIGMSLKLLQMWFAEEVVPHASEARRAMLENMDIDNAEEEAKQAVALCATRAGFLTTDVKKYFVWIYFSFDIKQQNKHINGLLFEIKAVASEKKSFVVNGNVRPGYRVGFFSMLPGSGWSSINRCLFEKNATFANLSIPVYIQSHALLRMEERLDSLSKHCNLYYLHSSILNHEIIFFKGRYLLAFSYTEIKLGYFVTEIVENCLLLKTFLFLTHDATPEGEKLKELSGLSKVDMKYWNIDRLSTFQKTDIAETDELRTIFDKAGCKELFTPSINFLEDDEHLNLAQNLLKYMEPTTTNLNLD